MPPRPIREGQRRVKNRRREIYWGGSWAVHDESDPETDAAWLADGPGQKSSPSGLIIPNAFKLVRVSDLVAKEPDYLVDGVLERDTLAVAFGDPGAGKSFTTIGVTACIATGTPFHGRETQQGTVIYIAGEGHGGIARRRAAWEIETGVSLKDAPFFVSTVAGNFLDEATTQAVVRAIDAVANEAGPPALIVVDTLARNFGGGDENSTQDMGRFIASIDAVRARWPRCTALIVHHTGHGPKDRGRGSTALKAGADAEYRVEKEGMVMTLECTKMKDGTPPAPMVFDLVEVIIGQDRKGRPITSLAMRTAQNGAPIKRKRVSGKPAVALQALSEAIIEHGRKINLPNFPARPVVALDDWRTMCARHGLTDSDSPGAFKKAWQRARDSLIDEGLVRQFDGYAWTVGDDV